MVDQTVNAVYRIVNETEKGARGVRESFASITGAARKNADALTEQQEKTRRTERDFNRLKDRLNGVSGAQKRLKRETDLLTKAYNEGLIVNKRGQRSLQEYNRLVKLAEKRTKEYQRGTQGANRATSALANTLRGALAGAIAAISFRQIVEGARNAVMELDNVAKTARNIGISGESLQEFRFALGQLGIDANRGDKALLTLGKRVGELRAGFGALKQPIEAISPSLAKALTQARDVDEQFELLFEAAEKLENVGDRQALLAAAFDAETGKVFNSVIEEGIENFRNLRKEARDAGLVIEEQLLRDAEKLNDQFALATQIIDSQLKRAFLELAPIIADIATQVADFVSSLSAINLSNLNINRITGFSQAQGVWRLGLRQPSINSASLPTARERTAWKPSQLSPQSKS